MRILFNDKYCSIRCDGFEEYTKYNKQGELIRQEFHCYVFKNRLDKDKDKENLRIIRLRKCINRFEANNDN